MNPARLICFALFGGLLLLGGCASFNAEAPRGGGLVGISRYFVVANTNDNRALDRRIAAALQARGFKAETGPLTMMPGDTQAIVSYQDNWNWDFGDKLVYLRISVRKPGSNDPLAAATFSARIPLKEATPETVNRLVTRLLGDTTPAQVTVVEKPRG